MVRYLRWLGAGIALAGCAHGRGATPSAQAVASSASPPQLADCVGVTHVSDGRFRLLDARWVPEEPAPADDEDADGDCRQAHYLLSLAYLRSEGACRLDAGRSIPAEVLALSEADRAAHLAGLRGREWSGSYTIGQCWNEVGGGW